MNGLKRVRARRGDALAQVDWRQLEVLLAVYYRGHGYEVEHVGTGATAARSDGGIDLKLRRDNEYVLVQVKHWNAYQVPHNDVHQLLGLMVNDGATGAILITSGEFTKAAIDAANRQGHVQLIDGAGLRALLGPLPGAPDARRTPVGARGQENGSAFHGSGHGGRLSKTADALARVAGGRLLDAVEDRIRYGRDRRIRARATTWTSFNLLLLKLAMAAVMFGLLWMALQFASDSLQSALIPAQRPSSAPVAAPVLLAPSRTPSLQPVGVEAPASRRAAEHVPQRRPTPAEIRESQRKADEAIRVLEATTPEM